jgi:glycosyltransferase involved in cell wall biosynthesis
MGVSVVIPCFNEEKHIQACLISLVENGYAHDKLELLVVDGESSDDTRDIVNKLKDNYSIIKLIINTKRKTPFALNLGIENARFDKIMIAGAHATYPKGYVERLDYLTNHQGIDVAGGALITVPSDGSAKARAIAFVLSHRLGVGNSLFRTGVDQLTKVDTVPFGMYRKEVFEKAGIYNGKLIRNHDIELSKRILANGFSIWLDPKFSCTYFARSSFHKLIQNNYRNGYWNVRTILLTKTFRSLSIRHYIPMFFVLALLTPFLFLPVIGMKALFINDAMLVSYFIVLFFSCFRANHQTNIFLILWAFVSLHVSYGLGSLVALITFYKEN